MPPNPDIDHELIKRYIDGTLDDVEFVELQNRLRTNRDTRELFWTWTRMEMGLRDASLIANEQSESALGQSHYQNSAHQWRMLFLLAMTFIIIIGIVIFNRNSSENSHLVSEEYVATMIHSQSVVWRDHIYKDGQRLFIGPVDIHSGFVQINGDRGAIIEMEGPATIDVTSPASVLLNRGKLTVRNSKNKEPFQTVTPHAYLDDVGAEYAVSLTDQGEIIIVYHGELMRTDKMDRDKVSIIRQGQVWRANMSIEEVTAKGSNLYESKSVVSPPIAWQSFRGISEKEIITANPHHNSIINGGWGNNGWSIDDHPEVMSSKTTLQYSDHGVEIIGDVAFQNSLKKAVSLNADRQIYFAVRFRPAQNMDYSLVLIMRGSGILRQAVSVNDSDMLTIESERKRVLKPVPSFGTEDAVLLVKISSAKNQPDQLMACVFKQSELPSSEPTLWHQYGPLFSQDYQIEKIGIRCMSKLVMGLHDIRIGDSWASITLP